MTHPLHSTALAALALATALSAPLAHAQAAAPRKVDRNELRACLDDGDSIRARNDALKARSEQIRAVNAELKTESEDIQREIERQEKNPSMMGLGRDRLERRKAAFGNKVAAAKADAEKFGPDAEALNKDLDAYNQRCSGISYDPADREAIMKEREAAGKK